MLSKQEKWVVIRAQGHLPSELTSLLITEKQTKKTPQKEQKTGDAELVCGEACQMLNMVRSICLPDPSCFFFTRSPTNFIDLLNDLRFLTPDQV